MRTPVLTEQAKPHAWHPDCRCHTCEVTTPQHAIVAKLEAKRERCLAEGRLAGAEECANTIRIAQTPPTPDEAARKIAARNARRPTARELGRFARVAAQMRRPMFLRPPMIRRPRQTCGGRARPGVRRSHAPPGDSEGEPHPRGYPRRNFYLPIGRPTASGPDRLARFGELPESMQAGAWEGLRRAIEVQRGSGG